MKRSVLRVINQAANEALKGVERQVCVQNEDTGTSVFANRLGDNRLRIDVILRGEDR